MYQISLCLREVVQLAILDDVAEVLARDAGERDRLSAVIARILAHVLDQDAHLRNGWIYFKSLFLLADEHKLCTRLFYHTDFLFLNFV